MTLAAHTTSPVTEPPLAAYDYELKLNPLTRALYFSAGADVQLLRYCPNYDRVKLQGIGGTVIATAILAFVSGSYAFYTVFGPNSPTKDEPLSWLWFFVSVFVGLIWAAVIYNLDRFIVSTTGHGDGTDQIKWHEFVQALPRILMACLIGFVIAKPLEIRIMKTEIDARLERAQVELRDEYINDAKKRRDDALGSISLAKQELLDQLNVKIKELDALKLARDKADEAYRNEFEGTGGTGKKGVGPAAERKEVLLNERNAELRQGELRLQPEIQEFETRIKEKDAEAEKVHQEYRDAEPKAQRQGEKLNGLIKRIQLAHEISRTASWFLTLMLIFIEVAPLIFKMMISLSPIDYLTENQKRLSVVRMGIHMNHDLDAKGQFIQDVKKARYLQVELEGQQILGKLEVDQELTAAVQKKFKTEVAADIDRNPSSYIERVQAHDASKA